MLCKLSKSQPICNFTARGFWHLLQMTYENILQLSLFAFVSSITPGPNNLMLMASGANYRFRRTLPHMLGVGFGFMFMLALMGVGLGQVFDRVPWLFTVLKVASVIYLLYLAFKIATAAPIRAQDPSGTPMTFLQACAFQWVNPKAWSMALTTVTVYVGDPTAGTMTIAVLVFAAFNIPCITAWTLTGQEMARFLTNPVRLRTFNIVMALLLVGSLYPLLGLG